MHFFVVLLVAPTVTVRSDRVDDRIFRKKWCFYQNRCAHGTETLASEQVIAGSFSEETYRIYSEGVFACRGAPYLRTKDGRVIPIKKYFNLSAGGGSNHYLSAESKEYVICGHPKNSIPVKCHEYEHWYEPVQEDHVVSWPYVVDVCTFDPNNRDLPPFNISIPPELDCSMDRGQIPVGSRLSVDCGSGAVTFVCGYDRMFHIDPHNDGRFLDYKFGDVQPSYLEAACEDLKYYEREILSMPIQDAVSMATSLRMCVAGKNNEEYHNLIFYVLLCLNSALLTAVIAAIGCIVHHNTRLEKNASTTYAPAATHDDEDGGRTATTAV